MRQVSTDRDNLIIQEKQKAEELEDASDSPELPPEVAENATDESSTDDISGRRKKAYFNQKY